MNVYEYPGDRLPEITFSGRQESEELWCNIRRITNEYIFYFVIEGDVYLKEDGMDYHLTKGDCFLLEPRKLHFGTQYSDCRFYYVHFVHPGIQPVRENEQTWISGIENNHGSWRTSPEHGPFPEERIFIHKYFHVEDRAAFTNLCSMFEQMLNRQNVRLEYFNLLSACVLSEIFIELQRQFAVTLFRKVACGAEKSERINTVLLYLQTNYMRKLTSADIEREVSYNFDYLNQLFSRHLHISIFKMLENIRMEEAKHILQTRSLSIREIAQEVGYSDETYFSKVFKKHTGFTPSEYRRRGL